MKDNYVSGECVTCGVEGRRIQGVHEGVFT